jgi:hypothetical protein
MSVESLKNQFARIGARVKVEDDPASRWGAGSFSLNVLRDRSGEFFQIRRPEGEALRIEVVDGQPAERHLLLLVEERERKQKFLCGHDERHWFVAAVPEEHGIASVATAMEALKPVEVRQAQARRRLRLKERKRRKTEAYVRQGEWFFLPAPNLQVDESMVVRNEPLSRGAGSKPHTAEYCYRTGGTPVYVCARYPRGLSEAAYQRLRRSKPESAAWGWQVMRLNPQVYVRGRISHADHKTIVLAGWHRVLMNTENQAPAMRHVAFLD